MKIDGAALAKSSLSGGPSSGTVFSGGGLESGLRAAFGNIRGPAYGAAGGMDGLGLRGMDRGGGGEARTYGIGNVWSRGRSNGEDGLGSGVQLTRDPSAKKPGPWIDSPPPEMTGSIDRDLVRQVIRSHVSQIRFCYESRLAVLPDLAGKVRVRFVIGGEGEVTQAGIDEGTTISDATLRTCVVSKVRGWLFPKPKGGGTAVVTYPFWLRPSGE